MISFRLLADIWRKQYEERTAAETFLLKNMIDIEIEAVKQFSGGIVYYAPRVSEELLKLQADYCEGVSEFGELAWDLYFPGRWTPHIALTGQLSEVDALKATSIMQEGFETRKVSVKRILVWAYQGSGEKVFIPVRTESQAKEQL